jgi:Zn-dependent protease
MTDDPRGRRFFVAFHLHELGHLLVARALGIKASTVTIGLGPVIAKFNDRFGTCCRLGLLPLSAADVVSSMAGFAAISIERWSRRPTIDPQFISVATRDSPGGAAFQCGIGKRSVLVVYFRRGNLSVAALAQPDLGLPLLIAGFSMAVALFKLLPVLPLGGGRLARLRGLAGFRDARLL